MSFKIAWRNIWRSRRRTLITISSIFFAVIFTIFYRALMVGLLDKMISDTVSLSYGYIQINQKGYWENRSVDNTLQESTKFAAILDHDKRVTAWAPRLESFALASAGENTRGMMVLGIDPA